MAQDKNQNDEATPAGQTAPGSPQQESRTTPRRLQHPLSRMREDFGALLDRLMGGWSGPMNWLRGPERFWDLHVQDTPKEVIVRAEAPGFEPEDFTVDVIGSTLTIRAEHREKTEEKQGGVEHAERCCGRMDRSITLPASVDVSKADARYH